MFKTAKTKSIWLWTILIVTWVVIGLVLFIRREKPIAIQAKYFTEACYRGDSSTQMHYAFEEEIEANGLTKQKLDDLYRLIVSKRLAGFHMVGNPTCDTLGQGNEGGGYITLESPEGYRFEFTRTLWNTDEGPKGLITSIIQTVWIADLAVRKGKSLTLKNKTAALLEGYNQDAAILNRLGIRKYPSLSISEGAVRLHDWSELTDRWQTRLKEDDGKTSGEP